MTYATWLTLATKQLTKANIPSARLDALILLEDKIGQDRAWILAHDDMELRPNEVAKLQKLLNRRAKHEPLAYIRGWAEFYGRSFKITKNVLVPRPESEALIDLLKGLAADDLLPTNTQIADIGAGSGALGITAALELPNARIELTDIDKYALKTAQMNVDLFTLNCQLAEGDLLDATSQPNQVLLCNLPYVPDGYPINEAARHEPELALFSGPDGLDHYRRLFQQAQVHNTRPLYILTESLLASHQQLAAIAVEHGYKLRKTQDLAQLFELQK